jgi:hypothetical protein
MDTRARVFGAAPLVIVERLCVGGEETFSPKLAIMAVAGEAEAEPAPAVFGRKFRHNEKPKIP